MGATVVQRVSIQRMEAQTEVSSRKRQEMESQGEGITKGKRRKVLQVCFDPVGMDPVAVVDTKLPTDLSSVPAPSSSRPPAPLSMLPRHMVK